MTAKILLATAVSALAVGGVAHAADEPVVGSQHTSSAKTAPVTIPGTGVHKGDRLGKLKLVYRDVTVSKGQEPKFVIRALKGTTLKGLAPAKSGPVGFAVVDKGSYAGKTRVTVRAYLADRTAERGTTRIYALVG